MKINARNLAAFLSAAAVAVCPLATVVRAQYRSERAGRSGYLDADA